MSGQQVKHFASQENNVHDTEVNLAGCWMQISLVKDGCIWFSLLYKPN